MVRKFGRTRGLKNMQILYPSIVDLIDGPLFLLFCSNTILNYYFDDDVEDASKRNLEICGSHVISTCL